MSNKPKTDSAATERKNVPGTPGHVARFYGVLPWYMAGGHTNASKKHGKRGVEVGHRQIILDTETTGLGAHQGDRVVEIGCIELIDRKVTGEHYQQYINPQRPMPEGAFKIHGLGDDFLRGYPTFPFIAEDFLKFIYGSEIIAHNAPFDIGFLNAELDALGWGYQIPDELVIDTYDIARQVLPGRRHRLDDLVSHYGIKIKRVLHGALLDARILAEVYLKLTQKQLDIELETKEVEPAARPPLTKTVVIRPDEEEQGAHDAFMKLIQGGT